MKKMSMALLAIGLPIVPMPSAHGGDGLQSFGFNADSISGFPTGAAFLTGGGAYDPRTLGSTKFLQTGGGFRCLADINQGPLKGCKAQEGIRWDSRPGDLLPSFDFKCTGALTEAKKTVRTDGNTVVMVADFYRRGDGTHESFTAHMFVSEVDEAPDLPGIQNVWIEGVGCGHAIANFNPK